MPILIIKDDELIDHHDATPGLYGSVDFPGEILIKTHGGRWVNMHGTEDIAPGAVYSVEYWPDPTEAEINESSAVGESGEIKPLVSFAMAIAQSKLAAPNFGSTDAEKIAAMWNNRHGEHVATVINNNQPGWTNIIETEPHVTLDVGTKLYTR